MATSAPDLRVDPVVDPKQIIAARNVVNNIYIDDRVKDYIVDVVWATREPAAYNLATRRTHSLRGFAARHDLSCARRARPRVSERPRLRHAAGRKEHRPRRVATSHHRQLRSRGGGGDERDHHRADFCWTAGAVMPSKPSTPPASVKSARDDERAEKQPKFSKKSERLRSKPAVWSRPRSPAITTAFSKDAE